MALKIHLLGPPEVHQGGCPPVLRGHRPLALLAYLVVTGKAHTRTHLTDLLFTETADPRAGLRWTLTKLRQAIGPEYFLANRQQVAFNDQAEYICDVDALLNGDLDCYRGSFLEGLSLAHAPAFEEWQLVAGQQLRQVYQDRLLARIAQHERRAEHDEVVRLAARLVQMDNLREEWRRVLMRAYAALCDWHAAEEQYEQCRQLLLEELATTPSQKTVDLWRQIRRRESTGSTIETDNLQGADHPDHRERPTTFHDGGRTQPTKLPFFRTSFIGRQKEIHDIQVTLADPDCRLLTVFGAGGIGKTRLAVQAAMNLEQQYDQGICFVPLRPITGASAMPSTIARALGLTSSSGESLRSQLLTYLARKSVLLILDNVEHLLVAADWNTGESFLANLLASAPSVQVLVTSRTRLHMPEEWLFTLAGLDFPPSGQKPTTRAVDYPAIQLFLQRARQIDLAYRPDRISSKNLSSVSAICQHTRGMPLAVEMAAAWVQQLSPDQIAQALANDLSVLAQPSGQARPARHANMHAVFEQSWHLLTPELQRLLAQLSVFRGRFDREAAVDVTGCSLFDLSALLDRSMLETSGDGHYQVHELLRQFGAEKLIDDSNLARQTQAAHSVFYCNLCHGLEEALKGGCQVAATHRLEQALPNLQAAYIWAIEEQNWRRVIDATFGLGQFCSQQGHVAVGRELFSTVLDAPKPSPMPAGQVLASALALFWLGQLSDENEAISHWVKAGGAFYEARMTGEGTDFDEALIESGLAQAHQFQGNHDQEERHCQSSLAAARRSDDAWAMAKAHFAYADLFVWYLVQYKSAAEHAKAALQLQRRIGDHEGMIETLGILCIIETFLRDYERAIQISQEQLAISQESGNDLRIASAHRDVGWTLLLDGRFDECIDHLHHARAIYEHYGQDQPVAEVLYGLAWRNCMGGHYEEAHRYADELQNMLAGKPDYHHIRGVFLYVLSQISFHDGRFADALAQAQESCDILSQIGSHNQHALALITLGFANLAHDRLTAATEQARALLGGSTTVGLWGLSIAALILVRQNPETRQCEEFYELLALQQTASPMCDSPSYCVIIEQLQPPEVDKLSSERRALAEARGRSLEPNAAIAKVRERIDVALAPIFMTADC